VYFRYLAHRFGMMLLVIFLAISINFLIPRLMPGDPIEYQLTQLSASSGSQIGDIAAIAASYRARYGLDQPLWSQYLHYWGSILRLDLGISLAHYPERVADAILAGLPWTVGLLGFATLASFAAGTLLGGLIAWPGAPRLLHAVAAPIFILGSYRVIC
jgi:peptide/nickel transport system permease protein